MNEDILFPILALIPAMVLHELAHGLAARALGDDTAQKAGRLTLNPLKHVDPQGSLLVPGLLIFAQLSTLGRVVFVYGWAKPVPFSISKLQMAGMREPWRLMALVAVAGPLANFLLAIAGGLALHLGQAENFLIPFIVINLWIGMFNLIPLPPLDGSKVVAGLLPAKLAAAYLRLGRMGMGLVLLLLVALPAVVGNSGINPLRFLQQQLLLPSVHAVLVLTGNYVGN